VAHALLRAASTLMSMSARRRDQSRSSRLRVCATEASSSALVGQQAHANSLTRRSWNRTGTDSVLFSATLARRGARDLQAIVDAHYLWDGLGDGDGFGFLVGGVGSAGEGNNSIGDVNGNVGY